MATLPKIETPLWTDTPAARKLIAQVDWRDFDHAVVRGIPYDIKAYRPRSGVGFAVEADLENLFTAHCDALAGFSCDGDTGEADMDAYIAVMRSQPEVQQVIDDAVRASTKREFDRRCADERIARAWAGRAA